MLHRGPSLLKQYNGCIETAVITQDHLIYARLSKLVGSLAGNKSGLGRPLSHLAPSFIPPLVPSLVCDVLRPPITCGRLLKFARLIGPPFNCLPATFTSLDLNKNISRRFFNRANTATGERTRRRISRKNGPFEPKMGLNQLSRLHSMHSQQRNQPTPPPHLATGGHPFIHVMHRGICISIRWSV